MATNTCITLLIFIHLISATGLLLPNFTTPAVAGGDAFLTSPNAAFILAMRTTTPSNYYLAVLHSPTNTVIWTANRNSPLTNSTNFTLSVHGLSLRHPNGSSAWSTPSLPASVHSLHLLESGNLILYDASDSPLWQSFHHPTDTIISDQYLYFGSAITSSVSEIDKSEGNYQLLVTSDDVEMRWKYSQQYWSLSTDLRSFKDHNAAQVDFMVINSTGLHLISKNEQLVYQVFLPSSDFRVLKLDAEGRLHIKSYSSNTSSSWTLVNEFIAPSNDCELPFTCNALGVCSALSGGSNCTCPARFTASSHLKCSPADVSYIVASSALCPSDLSTSYLSLGTEIKYFANKFAYPTSIGSDIEACEELCTGQCHCLGFSYRNSSRSCYLIEYYLGSFSISSTSDPINTNVYIKTFVNNTSVSSENMRNARKKNNMTILLSSSTAGFVLIVITLLLFIRLQRSESDKKKNEVYFGWLKSLSSTSKPSNELEEISIPGLPTRFTYDEVVDTTDDFRTKIGSGGFGNIYKGELPDKTQVAIKRMSDTASSMQGKKEYVTEIATIGSIHHHNLVRLYGFCAEKNHRILVYEYMNRGSLDQSLFRPGPVLGWTERLNIAIGTARGLAYLHSGCQHKIVHCDIKPENILLDEREGIKRVKISDFGLAKLLSRESMETFFSTMRGTRGYLAPEWLTNTGISDKSDVYSFGMVLLEIVRGRKSRSQDIEYVLEMHEKRKYMELPDGRLEGRATAAEVERVVKVALWCLQEEPWMRPSMGSVVAMLEGTVEVEEPMLESLGFLRLYSKGFEGAMAMTMG